FALAPYEAATQIRPLKGDRAVVNRAAAAEVADEIVNVVDAEPHVMVVPEIVQVFTAAVVAVTAYTTSNFVSLTCQTAHEFDPTPEYFLLLSERLHSANLEW